MKSLRLLDVRTIYLYLFNLQPQRYDTGEAGLAEFNKHAGRVAGSSDGIRFVNDGGRFTAWLPGPLIVPEVVRLDPHWIEVRFLTTPSLKETGNNER